MSQRVSTKVESGTCNVCSAPCSSCMHLNKASMGSKRKEYSDESCSRDVGSQFSVNDGDVSPPFSSRASENRHLGSDGKGNEVRFGGTREILSGNIENSSSDCDMMHLKVVARPKNTGDHLPQKSHLKSDQMSSLNEHLERVEGEDDNISCLSSVLDNATNNSDNMDQKSLRMAALQPEGNEIIDNIPDRSVKSFDEESVEKLNKLGGSPDSPSETPQGDESEEADIAEDDVKVCDICGDAGREDKLAICSRCSDGAEHIYCMREMLQKLPEGDWLCEECKMADETGKLDEDNAGPEIGSKKSSKVPTSSQVSHRGISEKVEVSSNLTVLVHETISSKSAKPGALAVLSRDSSIKDTNRGRGKLLHQTSNATHSIHDSTENVRTSTTSQLHSSKGALLKSNSFSGLNSKPKVKLIDEVAAQKQKGRLHALTAKDGPLRMLSKSVSFKSANPGRLGGDSKVKMLPTKFSHAQELKGIRHVKDGSTPDSMNSRKLERSHTSLARSSSSLMTPKGDQKPSSGSEIFPLASGNSSRDLKVGQSDGKPSFSKTANYKNPDLPVSAEHKSNHYAVKDESVSTSSRTVDRLNNNGQGTRYDGLSRSRGLANLTEKMRETPSASSRQIGSNCSRSVACSICKDFGHDSESCPTSNSQVGASNASTARSSREDGHGINKLKTPITSAMLKKPGIYRRIKAPDKLDDSSLSSHDPAPITTQNPSVPSDTSRKLTSTNGAPEKEAGQGCTSDSCKQSVVNDKMQLTGLQAEIMHSFRKRSSASQSDGKPYPIDLPRITSVLMSAVCGTSIIPEPDYVWQGDFKVCKGSKQPDICHGFQAHLSSSASRKVCEAVKRFPDGIILSEVPRLCTWPTQFDCGVHDENIALFFFAKDTESYEKSYKGLVDNMIKCDLALKASWDGVELLIFPSNQLPETSQRWNMLYYLWGVFRGRRSIDSDSESGSLQKVNSSNLKEIPLHRGIPATTVSSVDEPALPKYDGQNSSSCFRSCNLNLPSKDSAAEALGGSHSYEDMNRNFHSKGSTTDKMHSAFQLATMQGSSDFRMEMDLEPNRVLMVPNCSTSGGERMAIRGTISDNKRDYQSPLKDMEIDDKDKMLGGRDDIDFDDKDRKVDNEATFRRDHTSSEEVGSPNCKRKRLHSEISKVGVETSAGTSQTELWNNASVDKEMNKKQKGGNIGMSEDSNCKKSISLGDFASTNHQQGPKLGTVKMFGKECDERVLEDAETAERVFFPVISNSVEDLNCTDGSIAWKQRSSKVLSRSHDGVPNLELALGAEKRPTDKGIHPVLVGMLDKNDGQIEPSDKGIIKGDEDDASGSLSLSLSFPFPKNEQSIKPISDAEQPLQENHANASFLLFRSYLNK